jgi:hypothetical protein
MYTLVKSQNFYVQLIDVPVVKGKFKYRMSINCVTYL